MTNYEELLQRYKKGEVTEEERLFIEEEIKRYEAISDYICDEMREDEPFLWKEEACIIKNCSPPPVRFVSVNDMA